MFVQGQKRPLACATVCARRCRGDSSSSLNKVETSVQSSATRQLLVLPILSRAPRVTQASSCPMNKLANGKSNGCDLRKAKLNRPHARVRQGGASPRYLTGEQHEKREIGRAQRCRGVVARQAAGQEGARYHVETVDVCVCARVVGWKRFEKQVNFWFWFTFFDKRVHLCEAHFYVQGLLSPFTHPHSHSLV